MPRGERTVHSEQGCSNGRKGQGIKRGHSLVFLVPGWLVADGKVHSLYSNYSFAKKSTEIEPLVRRMI